MKERIKIGEHTIMLDKTKTYTLKEVARLLGITKINMNKYFILLREFGFITHNNNPWSVPLMTELFTYRASEGLRVTYEGIIAIDSCMQASFMYSYDFISEGRIMRKIEEEEDGLKDDLYHCW
ncbi:hypothetical protein NE848_09890 [Gramella jeungdoensis]|uniref:DNA-binding protein n=1 Tax=Gramella jeungdoensis TaxID=708091 RepID=A0ABT0Z1T1_9FLAO|nr:hypothetical protein [Gramella jeungdoensis]MCM8569691.1 hypothetical protein [Gramella jeungdoensis]